VEQLASLHPYPRVSVEETLTAATSIVAVWLRRPTLSLPTVALSCDVVGSGTSVPGAVVVRKRNGGCFSRHTRRRCTLSAYCDVPPADWRFTVGPHGKPH
jgi:hypothetical protein